MARSCMRWGETSVYTAYFDSLLGIHMCNGVIYREGREKGRGVRGYVGICARLSNIVRYALAIVGTITICLQACTGFRQANSQ
jgi:hypothetical protein